MKTNVLVVGLNKSGTSILTYRIASGLTTNYIYFEPQSLQGLNNAEIHHKFVSKNKSVTKCLWNPFQLNNIYEIGQMYTHKVWIIRDPRDVLISSFFYQWYHGHKQNINEFTNYLDAVKKKESSPSSISWFNLTKGRNNPHTYIKTVYVPLINTVNILDKLGWYIVKYEDFIAGEIQNLNDYLGSKIDTQAEVDNKVKRVKRSSKSENWRNYFTDEDVKLLDPIFSPVLERLKYDASDWNLNYPYFLDPQLGSEYMIKINNEND